VVTENDRPLTVMENDRQWERRLRQKGKYIRWEGGRVPWVLSGSATGLAARLEEPLGTRVVRHGSRATHEMYDYLLRYLTTSPLA